MVIFCVKGAQLERTTGFHVLVCVEYTLCTIDDRSPVLRHQHITESIKSSDADNRTFKFAYRSYPKATKQNRAMLAEIMKNSISVLIQNLA